jgi:hypothetical protein
MRARLLPATVALAVAQLVHGLTPADTDSEGYVGLVAGAALLVASVVAAVGAYRGAPWAPRLALVTGALVAGGFVLYHAVPVRSAVTNPYPGEPVGAAAWVTVALAVAAALWAAVEGWRAMADVGDRPAGP